MKMTKEQHTEQEVFATDLVIVGCGAAGLTAAVTAGELGVRCVALERRHRVGLKLLMCGNNRCNLSHVCSTEDMLADYGEPLTEFLRPAMTQFSPQMLRSWFARNGLATCIHNERIYPTTEKGDDVLHCFTDRLRDLTVPLMLNCAVDDIRPLPVGGYEIVCGNVTLRSHHILLATGGVSYPKTGSVGDGQRILAGLGVDVTPLRAGLAGVDVRNDWLQSPDKCEFVMTEVTIADGRGNTVAVTRGNLLCDQGCLRGKAILDATRLIAHLQLSEFSLTVDLCPQLPPEAIASKVARGNLTSVGVPAELSAALRKSLPQQDIGHSLKNIRLDVTGIRPLKEAIVTVGGVALHEIDNQTMELKKLPGIYVAGELMDVDGPTGGYNLHAAFATARLAVRSLATKLGKHSPTVTPTKTEGHEAGRKPYSRQDKSVSAKTPGHGYAHSEHHEPPRKRSACDARPGNRWDNSDLDYRAARPEDRPNTAKRTERREPDNGRRGGFRPKYKRED